MFFSLWAAVMTFLVGALLLLLKSSVMTAQVPTKSLFWLRRMQVQGNSWSFVPLRLKRKFKLVSRNHFPMSSRPTLVTLTPWETSQSPSSVKFWPLSHILLSWTPMSFQKTPRPEPEQSWRDVEEEVLDPTAPVLVWRSSDVMSPSTSRTGMEALSPTGRRSSCVLEPVRVSEPV